MYTDSDYMETGSLVPLENDWYLDLETGKKFRLNDQGDYVDTYGNLFDPNEVYSDSRMYHDDGGFDCYE